jgi:hypothetical protein
MAAGDAAGALTYAERWQRHDPDDPDASRSVGRLHRLIVERTAAETASRALTSHSAVAPPPELVPSPSCGVLVAEAPALRDAATLARSAPADDPGVGAATPPPASTAANAPHAAALTGAKRRRRLPLLLAVALPILGLLGFALAQWQQAPPAALPAGGYRVTIQAGVTATPGSASRASAAGRPTAAAICKSSRPSPTRPPTTGSALGCAWAIGPGPTRP